MSGRWFRVYAGLVDDPKWIKLGSDLKVALITIWCIAAENGGRLLLLDDMAIKFRLSEQRTKRLLDELRHCGFIDDDETGSAPHNWSGRQFQSDVSSERVKRFRKRQRNVSSTVSETPPDTESETDSESEKKDVVGVDARASPLVSREAFELADEIAVLSGIEPKNPPPTWCGAPMFVSKWLREGWGRDVILVAVQRTMAKKRDGPPQSIRFFEKAIVSEIARQNAPLPTAEVPTGKPNGKPNVHQVADIALQRIRALNEPEPAGIRDGAGEGVVRLLPPGRRE